MTPLSEDEADRVGAIFEAHRSFVESVARKHAPSRDDVPDVVQGVAMRMCRDFRHFRGESSIQTWLYRVTVRTAIDLFRQEQSHVRAPRQRLAHVPESEMLVDVGLDPEAEVLRLQRGRALREAIGRLAPQHAAAARDELSSLTVKPNSTHRSRQLRTRQHLRRILDGDPRIA